MDVEVRIRGLMMDPSTNMPIVVLKDVASDTVMPIWVGIFEANAIAIEIERVSEGQRFVTRLMAEGKTAIPIPATSAEQGEKVRG